MLANSKDSCYSQLPSPMMTFLVDCFFKRIVYVAKIPLNIVAGRLPGRHPAHGRTNNMMMNERLTGLVPMYNPSHPSPKNETYSI